MGNFITTAGKRGREKSGKSLLVSLSVSALVMEGGKRSNDPHNRIAASSPRGAAAIEGDYRQKTQASVAAERAARDGKIPRS